MAQAAKRISASTVQWQKLSERLTAHHAGELAKLKGQNSTFSAQYEHLSSFYVTGSLYSYTFDFRVNQYANELPKVDFAALKKKLPAHTATLDALQVFNRCTMRIYDTSYANLEAVRVALHPLWVCSRGVVEGGRQVGQVQCEAFRLLPVPLLQVEVESLLQEVRNKLNSIKADDGALEAKKVVCFHLSLVVCA